MTPMTAVAAAPHICRARARGGRIRKRLYCFPIRKGIQHCVTPYTKRKYCFSNQFHVTPISNEKSRGGSLCWRYCYGQSAACLRLVRRYPL